MRSGHPQDGQGHRGPRVADSCKGATTTAARGPNQPSAAGQPHQHQTNQPPATTANFEYDDNEWDIGIGDLIIDLDADIEKTNEQQQPISGNNGVASMAANTGGGPQASKAAATAKMHIEHSATTDKGLKMKIKRTKPGTKTSEAKHEIVKSNEQNGVADPSELGGKGTQSGPGNKHAPVAGPAQGSGASVLTGSSAQNVSSASSANANNSSKRGSSGHRRDKTSRDKHSDRNVHNSTSGNSGNPSLQSTQLTSAASPANADKPQSKVAPTVGGTTASSPLGSVALSSDLNGLLRASAPQTGPPRSVSGPGPPPPSPGPPASPAAATAQGSAAKPEQSKVVGVSGGGVSNNSVSAVIGGSAQDDHHRTNSGSPPPKKGKLNSESKG